MQNENGKIWFGMGLDNSELQNDANKSKKIFAEIGKTATQQGQQIDNTFKNAAKAAAAFFTIQQGSQLIQAIVRVRGEFQKYEAVLKNTLGSSEKAQQAMSLIADIAAKTPFGVDQLTASYIKLVNQGFAPTREMIISLGDLAASQGKSFDQLTEAIIDAQTGEFERLKEFGVRASKEGDKVTFTFKEQATTVDFAAGSIRDYILSLGQMQGVAGGMAAISETIGGKISNLEDSITAMFNEIGQSSEGVIASSIEAASFLVEHYEAIGKILASLVVTYGVYKTAIIATVAAQKAQLAIQTIKNFASLASSIKSAADAQALFNLALKANPLLAAASVIVGIATAIALFHDKTSQAQEAQDRLNESLRKHEGDVISTKTKIDDLVTAIKNENLTNEQRAGKLRELQVLTNGRLGQLTLESFKTGEATKAINLYIDALNREAQAKAYQDTKIANLKRINEIDSEIGKPLSGWEAFKQDIGATMYRAVNGEISTVDYRDKQLNKEKAALQAQNATIDANIRTQSEQDVKRVKSGNESIVKNKEYWEKQKAAAKATYDSMDEVGRQSKQGQDLVKQIQQAGEKISAYDITAPSKSASSAIGKAQTEIESKAEDIKRSREEIIKRLSDIDYDFTKEVRLDKFEGVEQSVEQIRIQFEELRKEFADAGIATPDYLKALDNLEKEKISYLRSQAEKEKGKSDAEELKQWTDAAVEAYGSYEQQVKEIREKYAKEREKTNDKDIISGIDKAEAEAIQQLDERKAESLVKTEKFFNDIVLVSTSAIKAQIKNIETLLAGSTLSQENRARLQKELANVKSLLPLTENDRVISQANSELNEIDKSLSLLKQKGLENTSVFRELFKARFGIEAEKADANVKKLQTSLDLLKDLAPEVSKLGDSLQELGGDGALGDIGSAVSAIGNNIGGLIGAFEKIETQGVTSMDAISTAANFVISTISGIISAAAKRKAAEKEFYLSRLEFQYKMNQAVYEEMKIRDSMNQSWFSTDNVKDMENAMSRMKVAFDAYQKSFDELEKGRAKLGQRNKVDWGAAATTTIGGAAAGAVIGGAIAGVGAGVLIGAAAGSVVPVIGTVIGAIVGLAIGIFAKKKKKDVFGDLMKEYPELVQQSADGTRVLNEELAKQLIALNLVNDETKYILQNIIDSKEAYQESLNEIKKIVTDVAGNLGDNLRNSLVQAFKDGEDAAKAFGGSVGKVLEDLIGQMLFNQVFGQQLDDLQQQMVDSFDLLSGSYDANWADDILGFYEKASDSSQLFFSTLDEVNKQLKEKGIGVFEKTNENTTSGSSLRSSIQSSLTEETGSIMAGTLKGVQVSAIELVTINKRLELVAIENVAYARQIADNTFNTVRRLDVAVEKLTSIDNNISKNTSANAARASGF